MEESQTQFIFNFSLIEPWIIEIFVGIFAIIVINYVLKFLFDPIKKELQSPAPNGERSWIKLFFFL